VRAYPVGATLASRRVNPLSDLQAPWYGASPRASGVSGHPAEPGRTVRRG
jgi:hypothetical protein